MHPYGRRLIIATPTCSDHIKKIEDEFDLVNEQNSLCAVYTVLYEGWNAYLAVFNMNHLQSITYGMVAHESNHLVDFTMDTIGQTIDPNNNEVSAYLTEWVVNTMFKHFEDRDLLKMLSTETKIREKDGESN